MDPLLPAREFCAYIVDRNFKGEKLTIIVSDSEDDAPAPALQAKKAQVLIFTSFIPLIDFFLGRRGYCSACF